MGGKRKSSKNRIFATQHDRREKNIGSICFADPTAKFCILWKNSSTWNTQANEKEENGTRNDIWIFFCCYVALSRWGNMLPSSGVDVDVIQTSNEHTHYIYSCFSLFFVKHSMERLLEKWNWHIQGFFRSINLKRNPLGFLFFSPSSISSPFHRRVMCFIFNFFFRLPSSCVLRCFGIFLGESLARVRSFSRSKMDASHEEWYHPRWWMWCLSVLYGGWKLHKFLYMKHTAN